MEERYVSHVEGIQKSVGADNVRQRRGNSVASQEMPGLGDVPGDDEGYLAEDPPRSKGDVVRAALWRANHVECTHRGC
jgi:hypothetical protein